MGEDNLPRALGGGWGGGGAGVGGGVGGGGGGSILRHVLYIYCKTLIQLNAR